MPLQKQNIQLNFAQGLDLKTDPYQVPPGKMTSLVNAVFTKTGLLKKRNGFQKLSSVQNPSSYITTFNGNLTAIGSSLSAYNIGANNWVNKGSMEPLTLSTLSLIKNNLNQSSVDFAVATNDLMCVTYNNGGTYTYAVIDRISGQNIIAPTAITSSFGTVPYAPRVFFLKSSFIILFAAYNGAIYHLQYIAVNSVSLNITSASDISSSYSPSVTSSFDAVVTNNQLIIAWNSADGGNSIRITSLNAQIQQSNTVVFATYKATLVSVCADNTQSTPVIYVNFYDLGTTLGYCLAINSQLNTILNPTATITTDTVLSITATAENNICTFLYEVSYVYPYNSVASNYIKKNTISYGGTVGTASNLILSLGLASKSFLINGSIYVLGTYNSVNQSTYFLLNATTGKIISKIAYENGGGYVTTVLSNVYVNGTQFLIPYLFKDLIQSVNNGTGVAKPNGIYSQTGINLANFNLTNAGLTSVEIGKNLFFSGGFLWQYDGYIPVENNFFVWPENIGISSSTGGAMTAQQYYYQVTYEWSDNQGNIYRSTPSIPVTITLSTDTEVILKIPTLRLTYKTANGVKIVIYRWSNANQTYYQVTSVTSPTLNNMAVNYVTYIDTLVDSDIVGNSILYTVGGTVGNINGPATQSMTLYDTRFWLVDAEDKNLLWFSKQVIEGTSVEMSNLFTIYVPPTTGAQGSTGDITALFVLDDKLIIFKSDAIYFINGIGPDNTGANSQYSQPIFITSTVGCVNQNSIVFIPNGLMFQSDKGIWLLDRGLRTTYIGAPVEAFNSAMVESALIIPGTNQVRLSLNNGFVLMYDYFFDQWGTFDISSISSTLYEGKHTFINALGDIYQEKQDYYLDGSTPVVMSFTTAWFHFAGLQDFTRAYWFYLLGTYKSPHKLSLSIAYDFNSYPQQSTVITPDNYAQNYGVSSPYGNDEVYGGNVTLEQWRVFLQNQLCQAFQITLQEMYDPSLGVAAGEGLSLSGLNLTVGTKDTKPRLAIRRSVG